MIIALPKIVKRMKKSYRTESIQNSTKHVVSTIEIFARGSSSITILAIEVLILLLGEKMGTRPCCLLPDLPRRHQLSSSKFCVRRIEKTKTRGLMGPRSFKDIGLCQGLVLPLLGRALISDTWGVDMVCRLRKATGGIPFLGRKAKGS